MMLCIDIGNSRIKWGSFDTNGNLGAHGILAASADDDARMRTLWSGHARALISCVAGNETLEHVTKLLSALNIPWTRIAATTQAAGVRNLYQPAEGLGADRWAALVGAWHQSRQTAPGSQSVLVVNAGSALTIDGLLAEASAPACANFVGGVIVPGYLMMQHSLLTGTAGIASALQKVKTDAPVHHNDTLPCNTAQALSQGALLAMAGAVRAMFEALREMASAPPCCMISGGDAGLLAQTVQQMMPDIAISRHDHLVLQGLWVLSKQAGESVNIKTGNAMQ